MLDTKTDQSTALTTCNSAQMETYTPTKKRFPVQFGLFREELAELDGLATVLGMSRAQLLAFIYRTSMERIKGELLQQMKTIFRAT